jgi:hypothetical protein
MHFFKKCVVVIAVSGNSFLFSVILAILNTSSSINSKVLKFGSLGQSVAE